MCLRNERLLHGRTKNVNESRCAASDKLLRLRDNNHLGKPHGCIALLQLDCFLHCQPLSRNNASQMPLKRTAMHSTERGVTQRNCCSAQQSSTQRRQRCLDVFNKHREGRDARRLLVYQSSSSPPNRPPPLMSTSSSSSSSSSFFSSAAGAAASAAAGAAATANAEGSARNALNGSAFSNE